MTPLCGPGAALAAAQGPFGRRSVNGRTHVKGCARGVGDPNRRTACRGPDLRAPRNMCWPRRQPRGEHDEFTRHIYQFFLHRVAGSVEKIKSERANERCFAAAFKGLIDWDRASDAFSAIVPSIHLVRGNFLRRTDITSHSSAFLIDFREAPPRDHSVGSSAYGKMRGPQASPRLQYTSLLSSDEPFSSVHIPGLLRSMLTPSRSPTLVLCARSTLLLLLLCLLLHSTCTNLYSQCATTLSTGVCTLPASTSFRCQLVSKTAFVRTACSAGTICTQLAAGRRPARA